ncbi:MAG: hypothetical protein QOD06_2770 [Candidatus Binatota bacterium]|nr:hypothetical protein [Candidatus Binatota bacterium]
MALVGYCDPISAAPGETVRFFVSADGAGSYRADLVRLINGDTNPAGPGFKEELVEVAANREYAARSQPVHPGSYGIVRIRGALARRDSFTLQAMIWPTTPEKGLQGILTRWSGPRQAGFGLFVDEQGCLALRIGDGQGGVETLSSGKPLVGRCWYLASASFDAESGEARVRQDPLVGAANGRFSLPYALEATTASVSRRLGVRPAAGEDVPLLIAAFFDGGDGGRKVAGGCYNGKIDRPRVASRVLPPERIASAVENPAGEEVLAAWDFAAEGAAGSPRRIVDASPNLLHGELVNAPSRAMTGYNWRSEEFRFTRAPGEYGAIHFHDDDVADAGWQVDFEVQVPGDLRSGVYAARLRQGDEEDYIPFYVRPPRGTATAPLLFLIPTASYLAYANDHLSTNGAFTQLIIGHAPVLGRLDLLLAERREYGLSTYDLHSDGSGVSISSRLRPILNMRPKYAHPASPSLWQFNADLHLVDWLTAKGFAFDVLTDEDLHREGVECLGRYQAVMTGTHPEYYSGAMLDAVEAYQRRGGRFMYMGANGFYWVTAFDPENPAIIEVRKGGASQAWKAQPGEQYLSLTGEMGGAWKNRGRAPQKIAGTGFVAQGLDASSYFRRRPDSFDPRAAWIFDGVGDGEKIGDFGLVGDGAAGLELDVYDIDLGTPPHALLVASSVNHTNSYLQVLEELYFNVPGIGGAENPRVRADVVFYETPNGGAVFSVSSIAWCGSLSHRGYDNNVSRITENVVRRFLDERPF